MSSSKTVLGGSLDGALPADPGVVHQDVELVAALPLGQFGIEGLEQTADSPDRTYIGLDGEGFPAHRFNLFDDGGCGFGVLLEIDNDHCPFLGQADGDGPPDATAGPRYESDLSLQAHCGPPVFC